MERRQIDNRVALAATILMVAASMIAASLDRMGVGFMLFLAAATPLPSLVSVHVRQWVRSKVLTRRRGRG